MSPVVLADDRPVARTAHRCQLCGRTVEVGETYNRQRNVYDGRAYTFKSCAHCAALAKLHTEIWEWCDDNGYTDEDFANWEPSTMLGARHRAQYRRKWRRLDGALYPIPSAAS